MKYLFALLIVLSGLVGHSQSGIGKITAKAKNLTLPLSNTSEEMRQWFINRGKQPKLSIANSKFLVDVLNNAKQLVVNPKGGTAFGDLDWRDPENLFDEIKNISIVGIVKQASSTGYLLYLEVELDYTSNGILIACKRDGTITNWISADGNANEGNPHGNINRDFTVLPNGVVKIKEGAWGDNTDTYGFTATFKVIKNMFVLQKRKFSQGRILN